MTGGNDVDKIIRVYPRAHAATAGFIKQHGLTDVEGAGLLGELLADHLAVLLAHRRHGDKPTPAQLETCRAITTNEVRTAVDNVVAAKGKWA